MATRAPKGSPSPHSCVVQLPSLTLMTASAAAVTPSSAITNRSCRAPDASCGPSVPDSSGAQGPGQHVGAVTEERIGR